MTLLQIHSYAADHWIAPDPHSALDIENAVTGDVFAQAGHSSLCVESMLEHARHTGSPTLRKMTFHQRARILKALALNLD